MVIKNIIPVTGNVITPEMVAYMRKYLSADTKLESVQISRGPASIECEWDEVLAAPPVVELCIQAEKEGCDGIFINCFGDPGVRAARECVSIPVFGGFEPSMHLALGLADNVAIVTVMDNVLPLIEGNVARAHLNGRVCCVRSIDIPVEELQQHEKLCAALTAESIAAIETDGAQAIALGCTAMVDVAEDVQRQLLQAGYDIPVIESAQAAVMLLELSAKMGLKQSRITYLPPPVR
ncbi:MAG: aspartate/glutamate racemase family protein [Oscillospiraceae bacterium]